MPICAFLSMHNLEPFECYDHLLIDPLADYNWQVEEVPWRDPSINWDQFDVVIIRSPWDYQDDPVHFMHVLDTIDKSTARLENSLNIVRWNVDKRYLKEMKNADIPIVPTHWQEQLQNREIPPLFDRFGTDEIIIKPVISANADHTYRLTSKTYNEQKQTLLDIFSDRPLMIQPFMNHIKNEGEYSLFYFAGSYSHTILKTPADDDFRVQEEHGGLLQAVEPESELLKIGNKTMASLPETPLYARVDFVRTNANNFALMELELIEPSLYFNMDPESPRRFARHFVEWMQNRN